MIIHVSLGLNNCLKKKGFIIKNRGVTKSRKRKTSETHDSSTSPTSFNTSKTVRNSKEDLENKQSTNRKNHRNTSKKKVLEEANNSKLRQIEVRVEDCLQQQQQSQKTNNNNNNSASRNNSRNSQCDEVEVKVTKSALSEEKEVFNNNINNKVVDDNKSKKRLITGVCNEDEVSSSGSSEDLPLLLVGKRREKSSGGFLAVDNENNVQSGVELSMPSSGGVTDEVVVSEEDDCVIISTVASPTTGPKSHHHHHHTQHHHLPTNNSYSQRPEDDSVAVPPVVVSSPVFGRSANNNSSSNSSRSGSGPRMDLPPDGATTALGPSSMLRFPEPDRLSDSGVSSLRSTSGGSGDERSGSRSSALSSSDDNTVNNIHNNNNLSCNNNINSNSNNTNRSPLFIPSSLSSTSLSNNNNNNINNSSNSNSEPVRVWRDPTLLLESEPHVRHIHSVQHQTLLMSHPSATPTAASAPGAPHTSASGHPAAAAAMYAPVVPPPPSLMSPHPLQHHHNLVPQSVYHPAHLDALFWKQRLGHMQAPPGATSQLLGHPASHEEIMDREREREQRVREVLLVRENNERYRNHEIEKQHKEMERKEREREKLEREKLEREKRERELEKQVQAQAVDNHFEKSLRTCPQKLWNSIGAGRPPSSHSRSSSLSEEDRKRVEQDMHREQQRLLVRSADGRDHSRYYVQRPPSVPSKGEYPPPPAHSRLSGSGKAQDKMSLHSKGGGGDLQNIYGGYCPPQGAYFEPKTKDHHKGGGSSSSQTSSGLVVTKQTMDGTRDLPNPPPLVSEMKNSVIVKNDGKNPHLDARVSMTPSPSSKMRADIMGQYLQPVQKNLYDYRSPSQSPHLTQQHHHHYESQNLKQSHHKSPVQIGTSAGQLSSPHHQRQSPHSHPQHPTAPEMRYRTTSEPAMIYPSSGSKSSVYPPFLSSTTAAAVLNNSANTKPKVSSPAPHHFYGKPSAGVSVVPVSASGRHESAPIQLTGNKPPIGAAVSPSPYQQVSQYHPPHSAPAQPMMTCPPPAHSSRTTTTSTYDSIYSPRIKMQVQSPPMATSAPLSSTPRSHAYSLPQNPSVQTQPLDLGVSSNKYDSSLSPKRKATPVGTIATGGPVCLEKKRRMEPPSISPQPPQPTLSIYAHQQQQSPQLARVSEPSPLIPSAATTITTVVNTAAYRTTETTLPEIAVTTVSDINRPASNESSFSIIKSESPAPLVIQTAATPPVAPSTTPAPIEESSPSTTPLKSIPNVDSEKSNSPGPKVAPQTHTVRHLKKAWLQRHTGEDLEDTTGVVGSGSCVTLPLNIKSTTTATTTVKENPVNSIHSVGSMAVNSISKSKHFPKTANSRKTKEALNGVSDSNKNDDSSSSDQERGGRKSPPKRKPPKMKRKKGGGAKKVVEEKKRKSSNQSVVASESGSDSDKESGSEKDSDSGASTLTTTSTIKKPNSTTSTTTAAGNGTNSSQQQQQQQTGKEPRKRGRRPKSSKNDKGEEPRPKKSKDQDLPQRDPFRKPPVGQLKKTGESFLQDGPCFEVAPKLAKCRECRWTPNQRSKNMPNIFCRFYAFRRLRYTKNGQLAIAGFSNPHKDALEDDLKLWLPNAENPPTDLDLETSRFLLKQVGDHFCDLLIQEKDAISEHMSEDKTIAWKRVVQGVREMCDVCETTLFNFHWTCGKCGFVVCLDCYKSRKNGTIKVWGESGKDRDDYSWLLCTNRQAHEQEKLMLTQIIAGDSLNKLGRSMHEMRELWNIEQYCACPTSKEVKSNNIASKEIVRGILMEKKNGVKKEIEDDAKSNGVKEEKNSLSWLADVATSLDEKKSNEESSSEEDDSNFSTLRELLIRPSHKPNGSRASSPVNQNSTKTGKKAINPKGDTLDDVISSVIEDSVPKAATESATETKTELKHFVRRYNWQAKGRAPIPIRIMTLTESKVLYPDVPHSWLCDGKLLRLCDPSHKDNYKIFQDQWKRGQPVIVSDVTKALDKNLWSPDAFARDFGDEKNDLVNCMTGNLVPNQPMRKFWEGFDNFSKRLKDDRGNPMLLKLKDWPPGEDFAEMLPTRFNDLMKVLPLSEYTHRTGRLNLASRLPECFVRPDLGPKMYNAYGSALHPSKGTTNLHLDISDAVNVMVYVGIPKDGNTDEHIKEAFRAIDEAGCDILTRRRVRDKGELPGALWHIYNARDADKIRDLLNKVVVEKGGRLEPHHDPIHDQSCYLDGPLRERLYKEYGVEGYAIVQCLGDAVFIPAGAPHQVRNLHNCIKVAEDFVSPENVSHCFHLTQEFRDLTDTHSNHEDKLQIKNIIYHAVKDSLASLSAIVNSHAVKKSDEETTNSVVDNSNNSNNVSNGNSINDSSSGVKEEPKEDNDSSAENET